MSDGVVVSIETGARVVGLVRHESRVGLRFLPPFWWCGLGSVRPDRVGMCSGGWAWKARHLAAARL